MKKSKRLISITLVLLMIMSNLIITVFAADTSDFNVQDGILIRYNGTDTVVIIPDDLGITEIGAEAFKSCSDITSVTIPEGVTVIGSYAFYCCYSLNTIIIPDSITYVGTTAFSATSIPDPIFINNNKTLCYVPSSYTSYEIPDTVTLINAGTFSYCKLTSVTIPSSVTEIGDDHFIVVLN